MKYAQLYALAFVFLFHSLCAGQNPSVQAQDTSAKNITSPFAPGVITRTVLQDRNGDIWIATFGGAFRYDGKSFINMTGQVSSARFFAVLEDSKGNIWLGTVGSGVYRYDGKSFLHLTTKDGLAHDQVTNIYQDKSGNVWFGTATGASRYDGKSFQNFLMNGEPSFADIDAKQVSNKNDHDVNSIIEDKTGKLWFGTRGNAAIYDGKTFKTITNQGETFTNVRSIIEDKNGNIWLGGGDGLWRFDGKTFTNISTHFIGFIYEDRQGNIWTSSQSDRAVIYSRASDGWILSRYDKDHLYDPKPTITEIDPELGMLFGLTEDKKGNIWFGGLGGVYYYDGKNIIDFKDKRK